MSIQAGIWNFDSEPADAQILKSVSDVTAQHGPDGETTRALKPSKGINTCTVRLGPVATFLVCIPTCAEKTHVVETRATETSQFQFLSRTFLARLLSR